MEENTNATIVEDKIQWIKNKIDEMLVVSSQSELLDIYTDVVSELGTCYAALTNRFIAQSVTSQEPEIGEIVDEVEEVLDEPENKLEETANNKIDEALEDDSTPATMSTGDEPVYAVFYSVNNAAYVAVNERMRMCVPVRNLAKAFCVSADLTSVAQGQNELSKYKLDKLKPIQIKFLTQKEYDDTIGKAKSMQALLANMPQSTNTNISGEHKVTNFAANTKSTSKGHIGEKSKNNSSGHWDRDYCDRDYGDNYGEKKSGGYDFFRSKPYAMQNNKFCNTSITSARKVTMTDMIECPYELYKVMHDGIDDTSEMHKPHSYTNDVVHLSDAIYDQMGDFDVLIQIINKTIDKIADTRAGWLVDSFIASGKVIDNDYMMDIDYALLDTAIEEWNADNKPFKVMYVEDFDPTIISFKKNIEVSSKKYVQNRRVLAAMAVYNYVRCLMAYESFKVKHGIMN
jgi:hypothetical protein